ncbi:MAG: DUF1987 domain-containing protein [Bacteroidales bacterium]
MDNLRIEKTLKTPAISFDAKSGKLAIIGRAIAENPEEFFSDVLQWIRDYFQNPQPFTQIDIQLEYINSASSKYLLELLNLLQEQYQKEVKFDVNWYYEEDDESLLELGKHYQSILDLPIKLIELYQ